MAPVPVTEDYYIVLEVGQTATLEEVIQSYKRLARKIHTDRNAKHDATEDFQRDESQHRNYDLIYPSITRTRPSPQATQTSRPPASTSQSGALSEAAQIAALRKAKQERGVRWWIRRNVFDSSIFELQRLGAWLLSPLYKRAEDSKEEKARKDRRRQERRFEKDMKERRLGPKKMDLKKGEDLFRKAKENVDAADLVDNGMIRVIEDKIRIRETRERQEREGVEREKAARIWQEQQVEREKKDREAAEAIKKRRAEEWAAAEKQQEEQFRRWQNLLDSQYPYTAEKMPGMQDQGVSKMSVYETSERESWSPFKGVDLI
ncbi:uncharacterized protein RAG0_13761 [Rhynchosporium agropyri]|uniref:J domain-containing protein n=1 Tax=Rhynchosporium agropyri TaxID=914238 RepID=A0A1E1LE19_9HELO|nr:uncharacterized protein RAG0_13761 [Rhynchosporium agropyri]